MYATLPLRTSPPRPERIAADECSVCGEPAVRLERQHLVGEEWACSGVCEARWIAENDTCPKRRLLSMLDLPLFVVVRVELGDRQPVEGNLVASGWTKPGRAKRTVTVEDADGTEQTFLMDDVTDARLVAY